MIFDNHVLSCQGVDVSLPKKSSFLGKVMKAIERAYIEECVLPKIADASRKINVSVRTVQRRLSQEYDISYTNLIERYHLQLVAIHIENDSLTNAALAYKCGFTTSGSLLRFVKVNWGTTTRELRMSVKLDKCKLR
jgi:AraC-like DNA-binding protein